MWIFKHHYARNFDNWRQLFFLALLFGSVADRLSLDAYERLSSMGMGIHVLVSLLLIGVGIYTQKKWNAGKDVSRHTFLAISMPCPVCLGALAVSCTLLSGSLNLSGIKIGLLVGTAFLYQLWVSVSHSKLPNNDYFLQVQTLINQKTIETPREKMMGVLVILDNACQNRY